MRENCCDLCHRPVTETSPGKWEHSEFADSVFCGVVMRAPERVAATDSALGEEVPGA